MMNAFEADLLLRHRLMEQKLLGAPPPGLVGLPSLVELQFRQQQRVHASQPYYPFVHSHVGACLLPLHPLDPAAALLADSQNRVNDLTMMVMADKARRLQQLHLTASADLASRMSRIAAAVYAGQASQSISSNQDQEADDDNKGKGSEEEPNIHRDYSVESSTASKQNDEDSCQSNLNKKQGTVPGTDDSASKKETKKDVRWLATYEELKAYHKRFGDCIVPRGYSVNTRLASWVAEQRYACIRYPSRELLPAEFGLRFFLNRASLLRKQYKLLNSGKPSSITPDRIALLNELDFAWNAQEAAWERHMCDLRRFRAEHGHCLVPLNNPEYPKLGLWVKEQRRHFTLMKQGKTSHMTKERAIELEAVVFCWDTHEAIWLERLRELADFKATHGSCVVPTNFPENPKLGTWVHHQRRQYKLFKDGNPSHITQERIRALERLGFVWNPRNRSHAAMDDESVTDAEEDLESLDLRPQKRHRNSLTF